MIVTVESVCAWWIRHWLDGLTLPMAIYVHCLPPPEMFTRQQQHHQYKTRDTEHGQHFVSAPFSPSLASAWPLSRSSIDAMMIPFETSVEQLQCPFQCTRSFMASVVPCVVHLFIIIIIVVLFVVSFPVQTYKYFIHNFATFCVSARLFLSLPLAQWNSVLHWESTSDCRVALSMEEERASMLLICSSFQVGSFLSILFCVCIALTQWDNGIVQLVCHEHLNHTRPLNMGHGVHNS